MGFSGFTGYVDGRRRYAGVGCCVSVMREVPGWQGWQIPNQEYDAVHLVASAAGCQP